MMLAPPLVPTVSERHIGFDVIWPASDDRPRATFRRDGTSPLRPRDLSLSVDRHDPSLETQPHSFFAKLKSRGVLREI
jgi:hypothetical protein